MKNLWSWVGIVILVAVIGYAAYYGWQQRSANQRNEINELNNLYNQLSNQNNSLQNQIGNEFNNTGSAITKEDKRILITTNSSGYYSISGQAAGGNCSQDFNTDEANTKVTFSSSTKGISIPLPYNAAWGNSKYRINAYDLTQDGIQYGPIFAFEGCTVVRTHYIDFKPAESTAKVMSALKEDSLNQGVTTKQLSGLQVVEYTGNGLCSYPTVIVIGQKYNYEFHDICDGGFTDLEAIVKTVKLL